MDPSTQALSASQSGPQRKGDRVMSECTQTTPNREAPRGASEQGREGRDSKARDSSYWGHGESPSGLPSRKGQSSLAILVTACHRISGETGPSSCPEQPASHLWQPSGHPSPWCPKGLPCILEPCDQHYWQILVVSRGRAATWGFSWGIPASPVPNSA